MVKVDYITHLINISLTNDKKFKDVSTGLLFLKGYLEDLACIEGFILVTF